MDNFFNRQAMLHLAVASLRDREVTTTEQIIDRAREFSSFCGEVGGGPGVPEAMEGALAAGAPQASVPTDPRRRRRSARQETNAEAATEQPSSSVQTLNTAAPAAAEDDFLNESPTPTPDPAPEAVPEKKYEITDVRAALVDLQSRRDVDTAKALLAKHTAPQPGVLGNLKPEKFAALIREAGELAKKGK